MRTINYSRKLSIVLQCSLAATLASFASMKLFIKMYCQILRKCMYLYYYLQLNVLILNSQEQGMTDVIALNLAAECNYSSC